MVCLECNGTTMKEYKTIEVLTGNNVTTVWLNRPEIHNAFNEEMISELKYYFENSVNDSNARLIILRGRGKSFCAGADIKWLKSVMDYDFEKNYEEGLQLSKCLYAVYNCPIPTMAIVHGASMGGANGLLAACDFAYSTHDTTFSLSEVKIGIIPAAISPYIIKRVGEFKAKELTITGKRFKGEEAEKINLINGSLSEIELEEKIENITNLILSSSPNAIKKGKELITNVVNNLTLDEAVEYTAKMIAEIRQSEEGQEGMNAFLEKRKPNWING
jgi:methylglutaconyl-CoA hydratase